VLKICMLGAVGASMAHAVSSVLDHAEGLVVVLLSSPSNHSTPARLHINQKKQKLLEIPKQCCANVTFAPCRGYWTKQAGAHSAS
jgi:hypothetical protein